MLGVEVTIRLGYLLQSCLMLEIYRCQNALELMQTLFFCLSVQESRCLDDR